MKTFGDLRQYINDHAASVYCLLTHNNQNICIQIYSSEYAQANIQINGNPVIKFEERTNNIFTVAMCANNDSNYTIEYGNVENYSIKDDLSLLLNKFSDSDYIRDIVAALFVN